MVEKLVSVIIPVYNSTKKLYKTVASIASQSIPMEILLIDDGSTKKSSIQLYEQLARKYPVVKIFQKKNEGIVKTRIFGISKAQGEFTAFSDHDDLYIKDGLKILYETIIKDQSDIVVANGSEKQFSFLPAKTNDWLQTNEILDRDTFLKEKYLNFFGWNQFPVATWGKIYKTSLLQSCNIQVLDYSFMDDIVLNSQIFFSAKKISFIKDIVYYHFYGGLTSTVELHKVMLAYTNMFDFRMDLLERSNNSDNKKYLIYELKNILLDTIDKFFEENNVTKNELFKILSSFRNSNAFNYAATFYNRENQAISLLEDNNLEGLFLYSQKRYNKVKHKIFIKNILKKIIR